MAERAYIGAGANLGDARATLQQAYAALGALGPLAGIALIARSSDYRTAPQGYVNQPDFFNACFAIDTTLDPLALLNVLQSVETRFDRVRSFQDAPRTLDLDLLLYGEQIIITERLTVPHPRMAQRAFVLAPLAEIAPGLTIPGYGAVSGLLRQCHDQRIERLS